MWDRTRIEQNDYYGKLTIVGHTPIEDAIWYAGDEETSVSRLPLYQHPDTIKVDTSNKTVLETAQEIMEISKKYGTVMGREENGISIF